MEVSDPSTIFIMPDIHSWRMMWDIAQSLWWSSANGPNLQWFKQMINDFSRGVWTNDIVIRHKTTEHELSK
jgi:phosphotransacetylase